MQALWIIAALAAGYAAGAFFYGGLRWTVGRIRLSPHPALLVLGSYLARTAVVLGAILLAGYGDWRRMVAAAAGLLVARFTLVPAMNRTLARKEPAS